MADGFALRQAGGPSGVGGFRFNWQGARVLAEINQALDDALQEEADEILRDLKAELHEYPTHTEHDLREMAFAEVEIRAGRRTLRAGSNAAYTVYHELGTSRYVGHPQIREIMDRHIPHITQRIRQALAG